MKKHNILLKSGLIKRKYQLTLSNNIPNYNSLINNNNYVLKSQNLFKLEKPKKKESIFKELKDVPKKIILKDNKSIKKKLKDLKTYFAILNDTTLDEEIVLNKYFAYLKKSKTDANEFKELQARDLIYPIKKKEKEIRERKRRLKLLNSISNQMLISYMMENKKKFTKYLDEVPKNNIKKNNSYDQSNKIGNLYNQDNHRYDNSLFMTCPNVNAHKKINLKKGFLHSKTKTYLSLGNKEDNKDIGLNCNNNNNIFITSFNKKSSKFLSSTKNSTRIHKKYYTHKNDKSGSKIDTTFGEYSSDKIIKYNYKIKKFF
jgi:hypothetical protein